MVRKAARRRGITVVETILVFSVCLMFVFGILEYGRFLATQQIMENAAREGARYAIANTATATTASVQNLVDQMMAGQGAQLGSGYDKTTSIQVYKCDPITLNPLDANDNVVASWTQAPFTNAQFDQGVAVRVSGTYTPLLPSILFLGQTMPLQATCVMCSEAN